MISYFETIYKMQTTTFDMINNRIKQAKYRLSQHKVQGVNSNLSIFEVAKLMDTVKRGDNANENKATSVFFSMN